MATVKQVARQQDATAQPRKTIQHLGTPRPWNEILDDLARPIPPRLIKQKQTGRYTASYVPVQTLQRLLDHYTGGWWDDQITHLETKTVVRDGQQVSVVTVAVAVRIWGRMEDGSICSMTRQDAGEADHTGKEYGEAVTRAFAQAFRRACGKWGLGLELWDRD